MLLGGGSVLGRPEVRYAETGAVGVVLHPTEAVDGSLATLRGWMAAHRLPVLVRESDRHRVDAADAQGLSFVSDSAFAAVVQAVVGLGGDLAVLAALRSVAARPVPVLGVDDDLGLLVEVRSGELDRALTRLVEGAFTVEPRRGLRLQHDGEPRAGALEPSVVFDDAVLTSRDRGDGIAVDLEVNGQRFGSYHCEAVVVATPTGSTAASYSAGGPVLSPSVAGTVITPVAPISGVARPVVLASDDVVRLRLGAGTSSVRGDGTADVAVDGVPAGVASPGDAVLVRTLVAPGQVVRLHPGTRTQLGRVRPGLLHLPLRADQLRELVPPELRGAR